MLNHLEKAFWVIGDKMIAMGTGEHKRVDHREIREENITNELVIRPAAIKFIALPETRETLNELTKQQICELANERLGINLTFRNNKTTLINRFLEEQLD